VELRTGPGNFGLLKRFYSKCHDCVNTFSSNFSAMGACSGRRAWLVRRLWRRRARLRPFGELQPTRLPLQMKEKRPVSTRLRRGR
jgi:hypothetical protein